MQVTGTGGRAWTLENGHGLQHKLQLSDGPLSSVRSTLVRHLARMRIVRVLGPQLGSLCRHPAATCGLAGLWVC